MECGGQAVSQWRGVDVGYEKGGVQKTETEVQGLATLRLDQHLFITLCLRHVETKWEYNENQTVWSQEARIWHACDG